MKKQIITVVLILLAIAVIGMGIYYLIINQGADKKGGADDLSQVKKLNCEDITDDKEKANCLAGVNRLLNSGDSSVCEGLTAEADKNTCRQSYVVKEAAASGDLNKCGQITDKALSLDCSAQVSFSLAVQKKDKKYCENIVNETDKADCFKVLADMGIK
ncbi:hypothetical protein HY797_01795 [Candidatus Falkowbacteria bacterium]|nr:hypothetical protein [Candidatus Falkowbacteria bacterium]